MKKVNTVLAALVIIFGLLMGCNDSVGPTVEIPEHVRGQKWYHEQEGHEVEFTRTTVILRNANGQETTMTVQDVVHDEENNRWTLYFSSSQSSNVIVISAASVVSVNIGTVNANSGWSYRGYVLSEDEIHPSFRNKTIIGVDEVWDGTVFVGMSYNGFKVVLGRTTAELFVPDETRRLFTLTSWNNYLTDYYGETVGNEWEGRYYTMHFTSSQGEELIISTLNIVSYGNGYAGTVMVSINRQMEWGISLNRTLEHLAPEDIPENYSD